MEKWKALARSRRFLPGGHPAPAYLGVLLFTWQWIAALDTGGWKLWAYPPLIAFLLWSGLSGTRDQNAAKTAHPEPAE